jgi:putative spermidine/putrescine transport system ATP-binding protein
LDKTLRESLQVEMRRIHRELGTTFLYVTHDQGEALALSDRIAVFRDGRIEQLGTTTEVYESPTTTFVASFIGESNLLRGTVSRAGPSERMLTSGPWRLALPRTAPVGGEVTLLLRPEKVRLGGEAGPGNSVRGRVIESVYLGASRRVLVEVQGFGVMTVYETGGGDQVVEPGQEVDVTWAVEDAVVLPEPHSSGEAEEDTGRDG